MPTTKDTDLDAARAEFEAARDELSAAQVAYDDKSTATNSAALERAQARYAKAGHDLRLADDPEMELDVAEYQRHLTAKTRAKAAKSKGAAGA